MSWAPVGKWVWETMRMPRAMRAKLVKTGPTKLGRSCFNFIRGFDCNSVDDHHPHFLLTFSSVSFGIPDIAIWCFISEPIASNSICSLVRRENALQRQQEWTKEGEEIVPDLEKLPAPRGLFSSENQIMPLCCFLKPSNGCPMQLE